MSRRLRRWAAPAAVLALVVGYGLFQRPVSPPVTETRFLMDTLVSVTLGGTDRADAPARLRAAFGALEAVDRAMAREDGTPLWALNRAGGGPLDPAVAEVVTASLAWARRTDGAFDPTVAPLIDLWDVLAGPHPPPSDEQIAVALGRVGWERVRFVPGPPQRVALDGTALDLGAIAKGYALDRAAAALRAAGAADFIVNAGGDLVVAGSKGDRPWRVGIQHPRAPDRFLRVVEPRPGALVTSGDYERFYEWEGERIHHILDPRTGRPAPGCRSVTVWAARAIDADALATAVFVLGPDAGLSLLERTAGAEGLVVDAAGRVRETVGFGRVAPTADVR